jgi:hypothetical protein
MFWHSITDNLLHVPILFFFLGLLAVAVRSDLEIPPQIGKFLSLYLLFSIGLKGGFELADSHAGASTVWVMLACVLFSFAVPFLAYPILKLRINHHDAGAIAASYGSVSAAAFAAGVAFCEVHSIQYDGFMVASLALMESPAIVAGMILIRRAELKAASADPNEGDVPPVTDWKAIIHESLFNGSVFLLMGALVVGMVTGHKGKTEVDAFMESIFTGFLSLYMLNMGLLAGGRITELKKAGVFLTGFAVLFPVLTGLIGLLLAYAMGLSPGNAFLFTVLATSCSNIAVPAAMSISVPQANMGLVLPMALGVSFTLTVTLGIPLIHRAIELLW